MNFNSNGLSRRARARQQAGSGQLDTADLFLGACAILDKAREEGRCMTDEESGAFYAAIEDASAGDETNPEAARLLAEAAKPMPRKSSPMPISYEGTAYDAADVPRISMPYSGAKLQAFANDRKGHETAHKVGRWVAATLLHDRKSIDWCQDAGMHLDILAALSEGVSTAGGALVPQEMSVRIIELMEQYGSVRANADILPMNSDSITVPRRTGGLVASYYGENQEIDEGQDPSFDNVQFSARKLACLTRLSSELQSDAIVNMADRLVREIAIAFATKESEVGWSGTGTSVYGGQTGVFVAAIDGTHGKAVVEAVSGNDSLPTIDTSDLINLMAAIPAYAKPGSKWYCSPTALSLVFDNIKVAAGGNDVERLQNAVMPYFLGYPIVIDPALPDDASATYNDLPMIGFGNLSQAATLATRQEIRVQVSTERYFELDQIGVRGTARHHFIAHDLGSNTVKSPFAVLIGTS